MTRVELAAIVAREGSLWLVRQEGAPQWSLPGGVLPEGRDDIPREMDLILEQYGIDAPAIEEDFVETHYTRGPDGPGVLNLYAPMGWGGEPEASSSEEGAWFTLEEMAQLPMDEQVRSAVLQAFGMEVAADTADERLATVLQFPGARAASPPRDEAEPVDALDVLSTLTGRAPDEALEGLRERYGELAHDLLDAIDRAWTGPALDRKTRSMLVVAIVAAMGGRPRALDSHIEGALNHGANREELVEVTRMIATYAGFPAAVEAWPVIEAALGKRGMGRPK